MVTDKKKDSPKAPGKQGSDENAPESNRISASTPCDFNGKNLTPCGGLLPVITMLEKIGFQSLVEATLTSKRIPRAMDLYRFVPAIVLGLYIGFPRWNQLRFIARDPILTGILKVNKPPVQSTFWRFVNAWRRHVARQILTIMRTMRQRVWEAANVKLEQYQLFETSQYKYRVFVTDMTDPIYFVVWFYGQRGGAENLIKEANNDAGLTAHPSRRFDVNSNHFQLAMPAYNLNCRLMLFNRAPQADVTELRHTTLATSRLRFLFVAARIRRHAGRNGVSYSDHYEEKGVFERLMDRLRRMVPRGQGYAPVMAPALR